MDTGSYSPSMLLEVVSEYLLFEVLGEERRGEIRTRPLAWLRWDIPDPSI